MHHVLNVTDIPVFIVLLYDFMFAYYGNYIMILKFIL